ILQKKKDLRRRSGSVRGRAGRLDFVEAGVGERFQLRSSAQGRPKPSSISKKTGPTLPGPLGKTIGCGFPIPESDAMKDTSDAMETKYRAMLLKRSGEERLKMGCSMHAMAQALIRASELEAEPSVSPSSLKKVLFLRFYGQDFDTATRKRILRALE